MAWRRTGIERVTAFRRAARLDFPSRPALLLSLPMLLMLMAVLDASGPSTARGEPNVDRSDPNDAPSASIPSAASVLAHQPADVVERLLAERVLVLQEVRAEGGPSGSFIHAYVVFERPPQEVYDLLSQSTRHIEFRPELTHVETIEIRTHGPIDEQRLKILFRRYVYRLEYRLSPGEHRIAWTLDERFDNDLAHIEGFWELFAMEDGRTLGRSGTEVDVGPAVPSFLQDWITRKNLPRTMERVRRWVDSDGSYRP